jgi:exodeoxyribonuclease VII large subunit
MDDSPFPLPGLLRAVPGRPRALTVSELNKAVKGNLEERFAQLWVLGEVTALKRAASGHVYFDLKDEREEARIACVAFRAVVQRARARLADGERLCLRGRPSLYVPRGQFQFSVEEVEAMGAGAAAAALAALKAKLQAEGLFAPERKRKLPRFPRTIGVVTSPAGAAFHDITRAIHQRWPARIVLAPTLVQGAEAPAQIVKALQAIQRVRGLHVVILGRGGGASEDLAAFNDERVVRAIANCRVPVVSAVGHEVDHTLADLVADRRASTPTMAAELCTPVWTEERERLDVVRQRLQRAMLLKLRDQRVALTKRTLRDPRRRVHDTRLRLDDLLRRAEDTLLDRIHALRDAFHRHQHRLTAAHPKARVAADATTLAALEARLAPALRHLFQRRRQRLHELSTRLHRCATVLFEPHHHRLGVLAGRLDALSPVAILARGYSVVLREGRALTRARDVSPGEVLSIRLHEGALDARVEGVRR